MGDTSSLLGNNCPMLYILYMLYKQSKICKSKWWTRWHVLQGEIGTGQGPFLGHHGSGLGVPAESPSCWALDTVWGRIWPRCKGEACGSLGAFPHPEVKGGGFGSESGRTRSLPAGARPEPSGAPCATLLLPGEATPQPPPSTTSLSLRGPRETIPRGKTAGEGRDWL